MNYKKGTTPPRRDLIEEYMPKAVVKTADRPSERKQNSEHSSLAQDMETSTGEAISKNGIRLWGMW